MQDTKIKKTHPQKKYAACCLPALYPATQCEMQPGMISVVSKRSWSTFRQVG